MKEKEKQELKKVAQIVKTEPQEVEISEERKLEVKEQMSEWGLDKSIPQDILQIPRILLMQGLSEIVSSGKAKPGDFVDSETVEVLGGGVGDTAKPVRFIPISMEVYWLKEDISENPKGKFIGIYPRTTENTHWPQEEVGPNPRTGKPCRMRNTNCISFFVLHEEKAQDPLELPYALVFKRTSFGSGKKLASHFAKCQRAMELGRFIPPAAKTFELTAKQEKNDKGVFFVMQLDSVSDTSEQNIKSARFWAKHINSKGVTINFEEPKVNSETAPEAPALIAKAQTPPEAPKASDEPPAPEEPSFMNATDIPY